MLYKLLSETYSCVGSVREVRKMDQGSPGNKKRWMQIVLATVVLVAVTSLFVILGAKGQQFEIAS